MYRPSFDSPSPSLQPNQGYSPLKPINLDIDMENLFGTQEYYTGQGSGGTKDYYTGQKYSASYGWGMGGPSDLVENESPIKEVAPVKAKKVIKQRQKAKMTINKEASKRCTRTEEVVLCKAWFDVSKNRIKGNFMKT
ncbi:hypothetical protein Tco_1512417, partial [Tanacetum coccineum]